MRLFEPITIGNIDLRNRLVMPPMSTNFSKDGFVTDEAICYYGERAKGGVGLIIVEPGTVEFPRGNLVTTNLALDDDKYLPMLKRLVSKVHSHGAKISIQLAHGGRRAGRISKASGCLEITRGQMPIAPSAIAHPVTGHVIPKEMSIEEIEALLEKFKEAAKRVAEAGFDFISLHCAHLYLCGQFLSPWANKRKDHYGQNLDGRMRFPIEIIKGIKNTIGEDFPIICRLNGEEPPGGNTHEEIDEIARRFQEEKVSALHVSVGFGSPIKDPGFVPSVTPMRAPDNCAVHLAARIKREVSIPVIAVNKIKTIAAAEQVLLDGKADLVAMGRPLIADPHLPRKAMDGRIAEIRPCIYCCQGCAQNVLEKDSPLACSVNPMVGHGVEGPASPAGDKKKVLILGGGPAGIQAALTSAARGHIVYLVEKAHRLGGQLLLASKPPGKQEIDRFTRYLEGQISYSETQVHLGMELTEDWLDELRPDVAIVACGSRPVIPEIEGLKDKNFSSAWDILEGKEIQGDRILIIGGGTVGCEVAEFLSKKGREVTIAEMLDEVARDMPQIGKIPLIHALEENRVRILTNSRVLSITEKGARIKHGKKETLIPVDAVVYSIGSKPNDEVSTMLKAKIPVVYTIGDSESPRGILEAIREGYSVGKSI